jgi:hypothetical protein
LLRAKIPRIWLCSSKNANVLPKFGLTTRRTRLSDKTTQPSSRRTKKCPWRAATLKSTER